MKNTLIIFSLFLSSISICLATVPGPAEPEDCFVADFTDLQDGWYTAGNGVSVKFDGADYDGDKSHVKINNDWYEMHNIACSWSDIPETAYMNFTVTYGGAEYPAQLEQVLDGNSILYY